MVSGRPYHMKDSKKIIARYTNSNYSSLKFKKKLGRKCFLEKGGGVYLTSVGADITLALHFVQQIFTISSSR